MQIAQARLMGAKVRRAINFAKADGWTIAVFGALTVLLSIGSIAASLLGLAMVVLGVLQRRCAKRLEQLQPESVRRLALHQLIMGLLIGLYGLYMAWGVYCDPHPLATLSQVDAGTAEMIAPYEDISKRLYVGFYLLVAMIGLVGCALTAWYYRSREKHVICYRDGVAPWILELQRAGMKL